MKELLKKLQKNRKRKKINKINEKIIDLETRIEYWENKTTENGTLPEHICRMICGWKCNLERLKYRMTTLT